MNILVTGAKGQLGSDVVLELKKRKMKHSGIDMRDLDITDGAAVKAFLDTYRPSCVIHCAAYTAVDSAEDEQELCMSVNAAGTGNLAKACRKIGAEMIYISTDYVFKGAGDMPHETDDPKEPLSVYGRSKLEGENAVLRHLGKYYIVRISWAFGENGNNFVKTMLKLAGTKSEIDVVDDQVGSPTYTPDLAALLCDMALSGKHGAYHATNEGCCSWAEFAAEIMRLGKTGCKVNPIPSSQYPTRAARPKKARSGVCIFRTSRPRRPSSCGALPAPYWTWRST